MLPETDWSRLYFALVSVRPSMKGSTYKIFGIGRTVSEAKLNGVNYLCSTRNYSDAQGEMRYGKFLALDLDIRAYHSNNTYATYYTVMFVEAKVYEYSKIWDATEFDLALDPTVKENVLRFVRVKGNTRQSSYTMDESKYKFKE